MVRGSPRQIPVEDGGNEADQGTSLFCKGDAPAAEVANNAGRIVCLGKRDCASALMRRGLRISQKSAQAD